jgi:hypothetical protein
LPTAAFFRHERRATALTPSAVGADHAGELEHAGHEMHENEKVEGIPSASFGSMIYK